MKTLVSIIAFSLIVAVAAPAFAGAPDGSRLQEGGHAMGCNG